MKVPLPTPANSLQLSYNAVIFFLSSLSPQRQAMLEQSSFHVAFIFVLSEKLKALQAKIEPEYVAFLKLLRFLRQLLGFLSLTCNFYGNLVGYQYFALV